MTSVDTNVILALWNADETAHFAAMDSLDAAAARGGLVLCGPVFGELLAGPGRTETFINEFLHDTEISVDWSASKEIWRTAGLAFRKYSARRRRQKAGAPRRILTDFYIGAHALCSGHSLLTLDQSIYQTAFPDLVIVRV